MTDGVRDHWLYYVYRAAASPGRPAVVSIDTKNWKANGPTLVEKGLSLFHLTLNNVKSISNIPDSSPGGIELTDAALKKFPPFLKALKCNGRLEGKDLCFNTKWSCTKQMQAVGIKCTCPNVGKRSSWHMGL